MNNKCNVCGTENEPEYKFCKNCGSEIVIKEDVHTEEKTQSYSKSPNFNYSVNLPAINNVIDSISGIPTNEVAVFVGKKAVNIIPKFSKMELTGSKASWCWPVAILGFLFGPIGSAFWFFYRKMYKPAAILTVIGVVLTVLNSIFTGNITIDENTLENAIMNGNFKEFLNSFSNIEPVGAVFGIVINYINGTIEILTAILSGVFGFNMYKNHCVNKIKEYRIIQEDKRFYGLGLSAIGGVSGGMVFLGVVIMFITQIISNLFQLVI